MSTVKVTKKMRFEEMKAIFEAQGNTELAKFCQNEIELLNKKNSKTSGKLTKTQEANEAVKAEILEGLEGKMTITDMIKKIPAIEGMTNQKVSALVRQLVKEEKVVRTEEKGRAYFEIAPEGEEE